ncbi:hypothetical protein H261_02806 [Paramagnetospirillum caucaseum]|uniref:Spore protein YkvP/CgeB glycosyl transferase-like domain-containing protein n=1 Tax=Paramagnetospirillum caucaseum TaxID=1244869 RepID=M2YF09_9PROT|nr:glycosyltransferase [Paramagnetospirillum caucaseum]EME71556.1 hypothetical protein H261_02806 [Paramagnetospirillum caucaseum]
MSAVKRIPFPLRLPNDRLEAVHPSLDAAFAAHDYVYVARFGAGRPELRGCALILLGNRLGGEKVLDRHGVDSAFVCLYRAYGAWRDGDEAAAKGWIAQGLALGGEDGRLERLEALIARKSFRVVFHSDFGRPERLSGFFEVPGVELILTSHMLGDEATSLPMGAPLSSKVPPGPPVDLVLIDDFKMMPVGLRELGAPVVVNPHDHEWYYEMLDEVMPEVDLVVNLSTWEEIELNRAFGVQGTTFFYPLSLKVPQVSGLKTAFDDKRERKCDIVFTGGVTHDFYRDKRQRIVSLARLDPKFDVRVVEGYLDYGHFYGLLSNSRFTINSVRATNSLSIRPFESLAHGALQLVEEESGVPYIFSEDFACFPRYRLEHSVADIEAHLGNYDAILAEFRPQTERMEAELNDLMPDAENLRAMRFLRHLFFMTEVEMGGIRKADQPLAAPVRREWVGITEPWLLSQRPDQARRVFDQTRSPFWVRRAIVSTVAFANDWIGHLYDAIVQGQAEFPESLGLEYTRALCLRLGGFTEVAEHAFKRVADGGLTLRPNESFPRQMDRLNGFYWLADAKVRDRCPDLAQLVPEEAVWRSYALNHRAEMAIERARTLSGNDALVEYARAAALADRSLTLFAVNESAQRLYVRAAFGLADNGLEEWFEVFRDNLAAAIDNDYTALHDLSPLAVHLLMERGRVAEAQVVIDRLGMYLKRTAVNAELCPEATELARRYGLPLRGVDLAAAA